MGLRVNGRLGGATSAVEPAPAATPLICTSDERLLDIALDWCSAVGLTPEVIHDCSLARHSWRAAPFVLVGSDLAGEVVRHAPPRRPHTYVISHSALQTPWDAALAIGAEDVLEASNGGRALAVLTGAVDGAGEACVISVVGATGGAGASCLSAGLAFEAARRGSRVLLVDGDPLGGGVDVLLGMEEVHGLRWPDIGSRAGPITADSLSGALPQTQGVWVLSWSRDDPGGPPASSGVLAAAARGFDVLVCDVPRHVDNLGADLLARSVLAVVVVPEDIRSIGAAQGALRRVRAACSSVAVVTAARRPGLARDAVAEALGAPVVSRLRPDPRLRAALDHGAGPSGSRLLRRAAAPVLDLVGVA